MDSLKCGRKGRSMWNIVVGVRLWGRLSHLLTNFNSDNWEGWIDTRDSLSTAVWKWRAEVTKNSRIHTLYSPLIVQSSIRFRYIKIRCFTLAEANLHVADKETPMLRITKKFCAVDITDINSAFSIHWKLCRGNNITTIEMKRRTF